MDPASPPRGGAVALAIQIHGRHVIYRQPRAIAEATLARIHGVQRIVLRASCTPRRANFLVGMMLARIAGAAPEVVNVFETPRR
ncbi:MAG: hypothetical protein WKG00_14990, partial [Polyangiaceae bacterium]